MLSSRCSLRSKPFRNETKELLRIYRRATVSQHTRRVSHDTGRRLELFHRVL